MTLPALHLGSAFTFVAMSLAGVLGSAVLLAQDPFGGDPAPAAPMAASDEKKDEPKKPAGPPPTDDVVILALRESNPTTPEQLIVAAQKMMDYGASDEARRYLTQLIASKPDATALAAVQRAHGSAMFLAMATDARIAPEGALVAKAVLEAARSINEDPERLQQLAQQTGDADATQRAVAVRELRSAGPLAVAPLVNILAEAKSPQAQGHARDALVALGNDAIGPLLGVLEATDPALRVQAIAVLTRLRTPRVIPHLLRPALDPEEDPQVQAIAREALQRLTGEVPSKADVEAFLSRKVNDYLAGAWPVPPDVDNLVTLWRWDAAQKASVPHYYPASIAAIVSPELRLPDGSRKSVEEVPALTVMAALLARDLYRLFPDAPHYRRLFLVTHLDAGKLMAGIGNPLPTGPGTVHAMASLVGPAAIEDALTWSIKNNQLPAAIAAAQILGDIGDASLLETVSGDPRPLALALRHPDRRLRFAAVNAIMKLKAPGSFAGASYLPETLGYLAGTVGSKRALVVDARAEQAATLAGLFGQLGYEADYATSGKAAIAKALKQPDYEVVLVANGLADLSISELTQQLRKDPRTASLLVGFLAEGDQLVPLQDRADADPLSRAFPYPYNTDALAFQLKQLFAKAGVKFVPHEERMRQAQQALQHLGALAYDDQHSKHYDLLRQEKPLIRALENSPLIVHAAPALGAIGSPRAQQALVAVASNTNYDLIDRQAAAKAFAMAVARRGLLLTTDEIRRQFDLYNASEVLDTGTQDVLASVLDVIEKK